LNVVFRVLIHFESGLYCAFNKILFIQVLELVRFRIAESRYPEVPLNVHQYYVIQQTKMN